MNKSVLQVKHLESVVDAFRKAPKLAAEKIEEAGIKSLEVLNVYTRYNHEWRHRSHTLQKDIGGKVEGNVMTHGLGFFPSQAQIIYRDGSRASYGNRLHEGFGTWVADPFVYNSYEANKRKLNKIYNDKMEELVKEI